MKKVVTLIYRNFQVAVSVCYLSDVTPGYTYILKSVIPGFLNLFSVHDTLLMH